MSWTTVWKELEHLAHLQLTHDAAARIRIEFKFGEEELRLEAEEHKERVRELDASPEHRSLAEQVCGLLQHIRSHFVSLRRVPIEVVGDSLCGFFQTYGLEALECSLRHFVLGDRSPLRVSWIREEVHRIWSVMKDTNKEDQALFMSVAQHIKSKLHERVGRTVALREVISFTERSDIDQARIYALSILAALQSGYESRRSEKWLRDLFHCIHPSMTTRELLLPPLIPRWLKRALLPIFIVRDDKVCYGLITGEMFLIRSSTDTRASDTCAVYTETISPGPSSFRVYPSMWACFAEFKWSMKATEVLKYLLSRAEGNKFRELFRRLGKLAQTGSDPYGRGASIAWMETVDALENRFGSLIAGKISNILSVRSVVAIMVSSKTEKTFCVGVGLRIISAMITDPFEVKFKNGVLMGTFDDEGDFSIALGGTADAIEMEIVGLVEATFKERGVVLKSSVRSGIQVECIRFPIRNGQSCTFQRWCEMFPKVI